MNLTKKDVLCERGNTLLVNGDEMVAWLENDGEYLEVSFTPGNYPALYVAVCDNGAEGIVKHINEKLVGWTVLKCNLEGVNINENNEVCEKE